jgi:lysophospholipase L1-like esterase
MIYKKPLCLFAVLACLIGFVNRAQAQTPTLELKAGDRVVFLGDSITEQRLYTRFVQQYVYCRYPELDIKFYNSGWSGNAATDGAIRTIGDVLPHNPTLVLICFGMNDGMYVPVTPAILDRYRNGMEGILRILKAKQVRAVILSPGCVDPDRRPALGTVDYNKTLEAIAAASKEIADKHGCLWIDLFHPMLALQTKLKARNASFTFLPDGVHPNAAGHLVMADAILGGLGAEPMPSTPAEMDAYVTKQLKMAVQIAKKAGIEPQ